MVNDFEVIHMGGRTYNPTLGRFMQADPFIQQPGNLQSYNRYAYVQNNPMSYTDPSGYFFKALNKMLGKFAPLVSIGLTLWAPWGTGLWASISTGFVAGGIATGNLRGALVGAFSAGAFYGVGSQFEQFKNMTTGLSIAKTAAHGIVGGITSVLSGGKFGHGFASAGITQAFAGSIDEIGGKINGKASSAWSNTANRIKRIVAAAAVGGTASVVSGGKFANGAITGVFSRGFNDENHISVEEEKNYKLYLVARGSSLTGGERVGHAFIGGTKPDGSQEAWGFYPSEGGIWDTIVSGSGKGAVKNDLPDFLKALSGDSGYSMHSVSVNRETYYEVMNRMWQAPKAVDYGLTTANCVTVATGVWNTGPAPSGLYTNVTNPDFLRLSISQNNSRN